MNDISTGAIKPAAKPGLYSLCAAGIEANWGNSLPRYKIWMGVNRERNPSLKRKDRFAHSRGSELSR
jgi:hypothetical protein